MDDPMPKYLSPELIDKIHVFEGKDYSPEITIKQLLSHISGIAAPYYKRKGYEKVSDLINSDGLKLHIRLHTLRCSS